MKKNASIVWRGIVKVQRALWPVRDATILVTSEDDSIHYQGEMSQAILDWLGERPKAYCRGELVGTIIDIQTRHEVAEQDW